MTFGIIEYLQGISAIVFIVVAIALGLIFLLKYPKHKEPNLILIGIAWMGLATAYLSTVVKFTLKVAFDFDTPDQVHFIINNAFLPGALFLWLYAITDLLETKKSIKYTILGLTAIFGTIFEIVFFVLLYTDSSLIGTFKFDLTVDWQDFIEIYFLILGIVLIFSAFFFSIKSILSKDKTVALKGKLVLFGFIIYTISVVLNAFLASFAIAIIFERLFLILSSILLYMGFLLPNWVQKIFLKEQ
jgi:hypothetical protein